MTLLAVDVGTTHCKAALFDLNGACLHVATRPTLAVRSPGGEYSFYEPEQLWASVAAVIAEAMQHAREKHVAAVGVASMAETGLLLDRRSGAPRSPFLPWFDTAPASFAQQLEHHAPTLERFRTFGIYPSFKCSLAKLLWWRESAPESLAGAVWLSVADYVAFRLTGVMSTDFSLAGRTYAFDLGRREWAEAWLQSFGLRADMFPPAGPALGTVAATTPEHGALGLGAGIPVVIAGHDHICAAFAAGVAPSERVFDSMGTAEVLTGALGSRPLGAADLDSGLSFGLMPDGQAMYWLGGLSSSGGALEWLRGILGDPPLGYDALQQLQQHMDERPGTLLFLPYLAGSGAPRPDPQRRAMFIGLNASHGRADMLKAVLEGTAFQVEAMRRAALQITGTPIERILAAGGGTRNQRWLQIKADVHGARIDALTTDEATLLGAALLAGVGGGVYGSPAEARAIALDLPTTTFLPDAARHQAYTNMFEEFWAWQGFSNKGERREAF